MQIETSTPVGQIAAEYPLATRVFARHGIDFCCGGGKPIGDVCHARGLDTERILEEIRGELAEVADDQERWDEACRPDRVIAVRLHILCVPMPPPQPISRAGNGVSESAR